MDIYFYAAYVFLWCEAELWVGTLIISLYVLCPDIANSSDSTAQTFGLLVNDAVERSGKIWASRNFRYCPCIWLEGQRDIVMNIEIKVFSPRFEPCAS